MLFKLFNIPYRDYTNQNLEYSKIFTRKSRNTYSKDYVLNNTNVLFPFLTSPHLNLFTNKLKSLKHLPSDSTVIVTYLKPNISHFTEINKNSLYLTQLQFLHDNYPFLNTYAYFTFYDKLTISEDKINNIEDNGTSISIDFSYPKRPTKRPYISTFDPIHKSKACYYYSFTNKKSPVFHAIFDFPIN